MKESERREYMTDAHQHGIPLMLDRMGMDGLGNEVVALYKRIIALEEALLSKVEQAEAFHKEWKQAEDERERLRTALVAIQSTAPGSAHRIAIQALTERVHCDSVDEYTCGECSGHNRCEDEMDAGFGDLGRDDPREDR